MVNDTSGRGLPLKFEMVTKISLEGKTLRRVPVLASVKTRFQSLIRKTRRQKY